MKKFISLLLVTLLLVATVPAFADDAATVQPGDEKVILSFNQKSDVTILYHKYTKYPMTESEANNQYTKYSNYSAHWYTSGRYLNYKLDSKDAIPVSDYDYINFVVYSDKDISMPGTFYFGENTVTYWFTAFKDKWTIHSIPIDVVSGYRGFTMNTEVATLIPTGKGYANEGTKTNAQQGAASTNIYLDSIFVSKGLPAAPQVTTTSIVDKATGVDRNISEYAINFSKQMDTSTLTTDNIKIKETVSGAEVTPLSITPSAKTATLTFAEGSFAAGVEYTVTVSNAVTDVWGLSVGDNVAYTFTTQASTQTPVANMTAPAGSATVAKDNAVLTATVSDNEAVNKVEFYEEAGETDTLLGEGVIGANGTYSLNYADFAAGNHTVYAVITYNNYADTIDTDPVTFNVVEIPEYAITGINNNKLDYYPNFFCANTIGLNTTEYVSKVTYFVDNVQKAVVDAAPFTYDLEVADFDEHSVKAEVVDEFGGVHNLTAVPYTVSFLTAGKAVWTDDYDNSSTDLTNKTTTRAVISYVDDPAATGKREGRVAYIEYQATDKKDSCFVKSLAIPESKKVRIDLDMYLIDSNMLDQKQINMGVRPWAQYGTGFQSFYVSSDQKYFKFNEWNKISLLIDFSQMANKKTSFKTYVNGVMVHDKVINNTEFNSTKNFVIHLNAQSDYYIDNLMVYNYSDAALEEPAVGRAYFVPDNDGWAGNVVVASKSDEDKECTIITAVYDSENTLIAASSEVVAIPKGKIINKEYTVNKVHDGQTGTRMRAFIWESVSGETTLYPLDVLN